MKKNMNPDLSLAEFEEKTQLVISLMFALCEAAVRKNSNNPTPELAAMTKAALALEKALETFLAVARICQ